MGTLAPGNTGEQKEITVSGVVKQDVPALWSYMVMSCQLALCKTTNRD